ncbi:MAG: prepilin-type N-terminal cleavage/methylation domain-containing protein [Candidatus Omnitrophota bacterium]|nr:prepilin-type N-terminal cleavage/methylation domain-containing protein [Candidatus Omnitrophota bacterium]
MSGSLRAMLFPVVFREKRAPAKFRARASVVKPGCPGGLTFLEMMVTIVILSTGIVAIYRSFVLSLDYQHHLACRLHANLLIDQKVSTMQYAFRHGGEVPLPSAQTAEAVRVGRKDVPFRWAVDLGAVTGADEILQADVALSWQEGKRILQVQRTVYLSQF